MKATTEQLPLLSLLVPAWKRGASHLLLDLSPLDLPRVGRAPPRIRIDRVLHNLEPLTDAAPIWQALCATFDFDANNLQLSQSGRATLRIDNHDVGVGAEVVPVIDGVFVSLALYPGSPYQVLGIDQLGLPADQVAVLRAHIAPDAAGLVIFSGPTWSGKNTAAYACLMDVDRSKRSVATVEEVPRVPLPDVRQSVINDDMGRTPAGLLRSLSRTSVDLVYLRELRDYETAEVTTYLASRNGLVMLTTMHTNDAPSTLTRMLNMGIQPFLVAATVRLVQAQRLLRRLCGACKQPVRPSPALVREAGLANDVGQFAAPKGCAACHGTGYAGGLLVAEQLVVNAQISELIMEGASTDELRTCARSHGMTSMREAGLLALTAGETSFAEVLSRTAAEGR